MYTVIPKEISRTHSKDAKESVAGFMDIQGRRVQCASMTHSGRLQTSNVKQRRQHGVQN